MFQRKTEMDLKTGEGVGTCREPCGAINRAGGQGSGVPRPRPEPGAKYGRPPQPHCGVRVSRFSLVLNLVRHQPCRLSVPAASQISSLTRRQGPKPMKVLQQHNAQL